MHEESRDFERAYVDGTFSIAFEKGACHPICTPPIIDLITNQTGIGEMFTFCSSSFVGSLAIGDEAASKLAV